MLGEQLKYLALTQSVAVTEDAVQSISTCKRLEVLDLQGTRVEVEETVILNVFFQATGLASLLAGLPKLRQLISTHSIPSLLPLLPPHLTLALQICQPSLPDIFHPEQQVEKKRRPPTISPPDERLGCSLSTDEGAPLLQQPRRRAKQLWLPRPLFKSFFSHSVRGQVHG